MLCIYHPTIEAPYLFHGSSLCYQCFLELKPVKRTENPLKAWRQENHFKQEDVARMFGVSASFISYIEQGKRAMPKYIEDRLK